VSRPSPPDLLVLHAVRVKGFADTAAIADRFGLDDADAQEHLLDAQAHGWVTFSTFGDTAGWSLTERGRAENERRLAIELDDVDGRQVAADEYGQFLPLNARLLRACTDWQLRPSPHDRLAFNDHTDRRWDDRILVELTALDRALHPLNGRLAALLARFRGYGERFTAARTRAQAGERAFVDRTDVDSCHRVWFELHEDLIATLGIDRRAEPEPAQRGDGA
jgi:hypothetical protein